MLAVNKGNVFCSAFPWRKYKGVATGGADEYVFEMSQRAEPVGKPLEIVLCVEVGPMGLSGSGRTATTPVQQHAGPDFDRVEGTECNYNNVETTTDASSNNDGDSDGGFQAGFATNIDNEVALKSLFFESLHRFKNDKRAMQMMAAAVAETRADWEKDQETVDANKSALVDHFERNEGSLANQQFAGGWKKKKGKSEKSKKRSKKKADRQPEQGSASSAGAGKKKKKRKLDKVVDEGVRVPLLRVKLPNGPQIYCSVGPIVIFQMQCRADCDISNINIIILSGMYFKGTCL